MDKLKQWLGIGAKDEHKKLNTVVDQQAKYIAKLEDENAKLWQHCQKIEKFPDWYVQNVVDDMIEELKKTGVHG